MRDGFSFTVSAADCQRLHDIVLVPLSPQNHVWRARLVLLTSVSLSTLATIATRGKSTICVAQFQSSTPTRAQVSYRYKFAVQPEQGRLRTDPCCAKRIEPRFFPHQLPSISSTLPVVLLGTLSMIGDRDARAVRKAENMPLPPSVDRSIQ
jgi:hypothetical protein